MTTISSKRFPLTEYRKLRDSEKSIEKAIQDNRKNYAHIRGEYDFLDSIEELINSCAYLSQSPTVEQPSQKTEEKKEPEQEDKKEAEKNEPVDLIEPENELERPSKRRKTEVDIEEILATKEVETDYTEEELARLVPMQKQIKYQIAIIGTALEQLQGNLSFINDYKVKVTGWDLIV